MHQFGPQSTLECPLCGSIVKVGTGGHKNLANHQTSKDCKKKASMKQNKPGALNPFQSWLLKKPSKTPAQVNAPPRLGQTSNSNRIPKPAIEVLNESDEEITPVESNTQRPRPGPSTMRRDPSIEHAAAPPIPQLPIPLRQCPTLLHELKLAAKELPLDVPLASETDELAVFAVPLQVAPADIPDLWETTVDPMLNRLVGFGRTSIDIEDCIRRGAFGMDGLCNWLEAAVLKYGIDVTLLEGKIRRILTAVQTKYVPRLETTESHTNEVLEQDCYCRRSLIAGPAASYGISTAQTLRELPCA